MSKLWYYFEKSLKISFVLIWITIRNEKMEV